MATRRSTTTASELAHAHEKERSHQDEPEAPAEGEDAVVAKDAPTEPAVADAEVAPPTDFLPDAAQEADPDPEGVDLNRCSDCGATAMKVVGVGAARRGYCSRHLPANAR